MKPVASFSAMFLWAILLIAVVGIAVNLTEVAWVPVFAWVIVAGGAAAGLILLQHRQVGGTGALHSRVRRERRIHRRRNDHT